MTRFTQYVPLHPNLTTDQIKWIEALESGKYRKGYSELHNIKNNTYCCLGVACEIFKEEYGIRVDQKGDTQLYNESSTGLSPDMVQKLNLKDGGGSSYLGRQPLFIINDGTRDYEGYEYSFVGIANLLKTGEYFANCQQDYAPESNE